MLPTIASSFGSFLQGSPVSVLERGLARDQKNTREALLATLRMLHAQIAGTSIDDLCTELFSKRAFLSCVSEIGGSQLIISRDTFLPLYNDFIQKFINPRVGSDAQPSLPQLPVDAYRWFAMELQNVSSSGDVENHFVTICSVFKPFLRALIQAGPTIAIETNPLHEQTIEFTSLIVSFLINDVERSIKSLQSRDDNDSDKLIRLSLRLCPLLDILATFLFTMTGICVAAVHGDGKSAPVVTSDQHRQSLQLLNVASNLLQICQPLLVSIGVLSENLPNEAFESEFEDGLYDANSMLHSLGRAFGSVVVNMEHGVAGFGATGFTACQAFFGPDGPGGISGDVGWHAEREPYANSRQHGIVGYYSHKMEFSFNNSLRFLFSTVSTLATILLTSMTHPPNALGYFKQLPLSTIHPESFFEGWLSLPCFQTPHAHATPLRHFTNSLVSFAKESVPWEDKNGLDVSATPSPRLRRFYQYLLSLFPQRGAAAKRKYFPDVEALFVAACIVSSATVPLAVDSSSSHSPSKPMDHADPTNTSTSNSEIHPGFVARQLALWNIVEDTLLQLEAQGGTGDGTVSIPTNPCFELLWKRLLEFRRWTQEKVDAFSEARSTLEALLPTVESSPKTTSSASKDTSNPFRPKQDRDEATEVISDTPVGDLQTNKSLVYPVLCGSIPGVTLTTEMFLSPDSPNVSKLLSDIFLHSISSRLSYLLYMPGNKSTDATDELSEDCLYPLLAPDHFSFLADQTTAVHNSKYPSQNIPNLPPTSRLYGRSFVIASDSAKDAWKPASVEKPLWDRIHLFGNTGALNSSFLSVHLYARDGWICPPSVVEEFREVRNMRAQCRANAFRTFSLLFGTCIRSPIHWTSRQLLKGMVDAFLGTLPSYWLRLEGSLHSTDPVPFLPLSAHKNHPLLGLRGADTEIYKDAALACYSFFQIVAKATTFALKQLEKCSVLDSRYWGYSLDTIQPRRRHGEYGSIATADSVPALLALLLGIDWMYSEANQILHKSGVPDALMSVTSSQTLVRNTEAFRRATAERAFLGLGAKGTPWVPVHPLSLLHGLIGGFISNNDALVHMYAGCVSHGSPNTLLEVLHTITGIRYPDLCPEIDGGCDPQAVEVYPCDSGSRLSQDPHPFSISRSDMQAASSDVDMEFCAMNPEPISFSSLATPGLGSSTNPTTTPTLNYNTGLVSGLSTGLSSMQAKDGKDRGTRSPTLSVVSNPEDVPLLPPNHLSAMEEMDDNEDEGPTAPDSYPSFSPVTSFLNVIDDIAQALEPTTVVSAYAALLSHDLFKPTTKGMNVVVSTATDATKSPNAADISLKPLDMFGSPSEQLVSLPSLHPLHQYGPMKAHAGDEDVGDVDEQWQVRKGMDIDELESLFRGEGKFFYSCADNPASQPSMKSNENTTEPFGRPVVNQAMAGISQISEMSEMWGLIGCDVFHVIRDLTACPQKIFFPLISQAIFRSIPMLAQSAAYSTLMDHLLTPIAVAASKLDANSIHVRMNPVSDRTAADPPSEMSFHLYPQRLSRSLLQSVTFASTRYLSLAISARNLQPQTVDWMKSRVEDLFALTLPFLFSINSPLAQKISIANFLTALLPYLSPVTVMNTFSSIILTSSAPLFVPSLLLLLAAANTPLLHPRSEEQFSRELRAIVGVSTTATKLLIPATCREVAGTTWGPGTSYALKVFSAAILRVLRTLQNMDGWTGHILDVCTAAIIRGVEYVRSTPLDHYTAQGKPLSPHLLPPNSAQVALAAAALTVLGGNQAPLHVGSTVRIFSPKDPSINGTIAVLLHTPHYRGADIPVTVLRQVQQVPQEDLTHIPPFLHYQDPYTTAPHLFLSLYPYEITAESKDAAPGRFQGLESNIPFFEAVFTIFSLPSLPAEVFLDDQSSLFSSPPDACVVPVYELMLLQLRHTAARCIQTLIGSVYDNNQAANDELTTMREKFTRTLLLLKGTRYLVSMAMQQLPVLAFPSISNAESAAQSAVERLVDLSNVTFPTLSDRSPLPVYRSLPSGVALAQGRHANAPREIDSVLQVSLTSRLPVPSPPLHTQRKVFAPAFNNQSIQSNVGASSGPEENKLYPPPHANMQYWDLAKETHIALVGDDENASPSRYWVYKAIVMHKGNADVSFNWLLDNPEPPGYAETCAAEAKNFALESTGGGILGPTSREVVSVKIEQAYAQFLKAHQKKERSGFYGYIDTSEIPSMDTMDLEEDFVDADIDFPIQSMKDAKRPARDSYQRMDEEDQVVGTQPISPMYTGTYAYSSATQGDQSYESTSLPLGCTYLTRGSSGTMQLDFLEGSSFGARNGDGSEQGKGNVARYDECMIEGISYTEPLISDLPPRLPVGYTPVNKSQLLANGKAGTVAATDAALQTGAASKRGLFKGRDKRGHTTGFGKSSAIWYKDVETWSFDGLGDDMLGDKDRPNSYEIGEIGAITTAQMDAGASQGVSLSQWKNVSLRVCALQMDITGLGLQQAVEKGRMEVQRQSFELSLLSTNTNKFQNLSGDAPTSLSILRPQVPVHTLPAGTMVWVEAHRSPEGILAPVIIGPSPGTHSWTAIAKTIQSKLANDLFDHISLDGGTSAGYGVVATIVRHSTLRIPIPRKKQPNSSAIREYMSGTYNRTVKAQFEDPVINVTVVRVALPYSVGFDSFELVVPSSWIHVPTSAYENSCTLLQLPVNAAETDVSIPLAGLQTLAATQFATATIKLAREMLVSLLLNWNPRIPMTLQDFAPSYLIRPGNDTVPLPLAASSRNSSRAAKSLILLLKSCTVKDGTLHRRYNVHVPASSAFTRDDSSMHSGFANAGSSSALQAVLMAMVEADVKGRPYFGGTERRHIAGDTTIRPSATYIWICSNCSHICDGVKRSASGSHELQCPSCSHLAPPPPSFSESPESLALISYLVHDALFSLNEAAEACSLSGHHAVTKSSFIPSGTISEPFETGSLSFANAGAMYVTFDDRCNTNAADELSYFSLYAPYRNISTSNHVEPYFCTTASPDDVVAHNLCNIVTIRGGPHMFKTCMIAGNQLHWLTSKGKGTSHSAGNRSSDYEVGVKFTVTPMNSIVWESDAALREKSSLLWGLWSLHSLFNGNLPPSLLSKGILHNANVISVLIDFLRTSGAPFKEHIVSLLRVVFSIPEYLLMTPSHKDYQYWGTKEVEQLIAHVGMPDSHKAIPPSLDSDILQFFTIVPIRAVMFMRDMAKACAQQVIKANNLFLPRQLQRLMELLETAEAALRRTRVQMYLIAHTNGNLYRPSVSGRVVPPLLSNYGHPETFSPQGQLLVSMLSRCDSAVPPFSLQSSPERWEQWRPPLIPCKPELVPNMSDYDALCALRELLITCLTGRRIPDAWMLRAYLCATRINPNDLGDVKPVHIAQAHLYSAASTPLEDEATLSWLSAVAARKGMQGALDVQLVHADLTESDVSSFPHLDRFRGGEEHPDTPSLALRVRAGVLLIINHLIKRCISLIDMDGLPEGLNDWIAGPQGDSTGAVSVYLSGNEEQVYETQRNGYRDTIDANAVDDAPWLGLHNLARMTVGSMLRRLSHLVLVESKETLIFKAIDASGSVGASGVKVLLDNRPALVSLDEGIVDPSSSLCIFAQLARHMMEGKVADRQLRSKLSTKQTLFDVAYVGLAGTTEEGIDYGGIYRETMVKCMQDLFGDRPGIDLFTLSPNAFAARDIHMTIDTADLAAAASEGQFLPNPRYSMLNLESADLLPIAYAPKRCTTQSLHNLTSAMYEWVGRLLAISMRTRSSDLEADLAPPLWKMLAGEPLTIADISSLDLSLGSFLKSIWEWKYNPAIHGDPEAIREELGRSEPLDSSEVAELAFGLNFGKLAFVLPNFPLTQMSHHLDTSVLSPEIFESRTKQSQFLDHPLVPGGANMHVTLLNRHKYVASVISAVMRPYQHAIACIRRGMTLIVPERAIALCGWRDLRRLVCGQPDIDIDTLMKNTKYDSQNYYHPNHPVVKNFWRAMRELAPEQKRNFVRFAWGRTRLPIGEWPTLHTGQKVKFILVPMRNKYSGLPLSHTCFFMIELPEYQDFESLKRALITAITYGASAEFAIA